MLTCPSCQSRFPRVREDAPLVHQPDGTHTLSDCGAATLEASGLRESPHRLIIRSLRDLHATCRCGAWELTAPTFVRDTDASLRHRALAAWEAPYGAGVHTPLASVRGEWKKQYLNDIDA